MSKGGIVILTLLCFVSCSRKIEDSMNATSCSPIPLGRASATCFTLDGKAYIFGGRTGDKDGFLSDLWQYDAAIDEWTPCTQPPLRARVQAAAITVGSTAYLGMGFNGTVYTDSCYLRDFWAFDGTNWQRLADYPTRYSNGVQLFYENGNIYAMFGFYDGFPREIYRYDIAANKWEETEMRVQNNTRVSMASVAVDCSGRHFIGTGYNANKSEVWSEWVIEDNSWTRRKRVPGGLRCSAAAATDNHQILLFGGRLWQGTADGQHLADDIWQYLPEEDHWTMLALMPEAAENMIAFYMNGSFYFGLGENEKGERLNILWRLEEKN